MFELNASQLGQRMKAIRIALGLTQKDCAPALGVSSKSLSSYERGIYFPHIQFMWKYITCYNVNIRYLFLGIGEMFDSTPLVFDSPDGAAPAAAGIKVLSIS